MGESVSLKLEGADKLLKALEELEQGAGKALKTAGKAGAEVFKDAAQEKAPGPGIGLEVVKSSRGVVEVAVGPKKKNWYYRFFETGARPHEIQAAGADALRIPGVGREFFESAQNAGGVGAQPFLRPAFDTKREAALAAFGDMIWKVIGRFK